MRRDPASVGVGQGSADQVVRRMARSHTAPEHMENGLFFLSGQATGCSAPSQTRRNRCPSSLSDFGLDFP